MIRRLALCALFCALLPFPAYAETPPAWTQTSLEAALQAEFKALETESVLVLVVEGDAVTGLFSLGRPLDPQVAYDLGRLSDLFVSTLWLALEERGGFPRALPIQRLYPQFRLNLAHGSANITPASLMNHTAGLGSVDLPPLAAKAWPSYASLTPRDFPTSRYSYCTACYALLIDLLEAQNNQPISRLLENYLFEPLRMDATHVRRGRLWATPQDLAVFMSVQSQYGRWRDVQLITPESTRALHGAYLRTLRSLTEHTGYGVRVWPGAGLGVRDPLDDRVVFAEDTLEGRAALAFIPVRHQAVLLLSDQPTRGLEELAVLALAEISGWMPPAPFTPRLGELNAGGFRSPDPVYGGDLRLQAEGETLRVLYRATEAEATFVQERVFRFLHDGRWARGFLVRGGRSSQLLLSIDGVTTLFERYN